MPESDRPARRRPSPLELLYRVFRILARLGRREPRRRLPRHPPAAPGDVVPLPPSGREQQVLSVLARAERPLKGRTVANRAGVRYTSHFREVLSGLVACGKVLRRPSGGYWPADRPAPADD